MARASDWPVGEGELQNEEEKEGEDSDPFRLNIEVIRTYHILYGCPSDSERRQV